MPGSGHIGFEIFDRTAFGVTEFLEHVNYRRALEGELARTISTHREVAGARVHIAMPQPSLFAGREQPTKASVILKLRSNRQLSASTVGAITGLVAASVESLQPEAVVIIDNFGRPLSQAGDADEADDGVPLRTPAADRSATCRRASSRLLEPIVGPGRVRVNVSATLKADTEEETEERWDPTPVVRSQQSVTQIAPADWPPSGASLRPAVSPARARTCRRTRRRPTKPTPSRSGRGRRPTRRTGAAHTAETTNYEVSKLTRHTSQPRGDIAQLSVAVILDDEHPARAGGGTRDAAAAPRSARAGRRHSEDPRARRRGRRPRCRSRRSADGREHRVRGDRRSKTVADARRVAAVSAPQVVRSAAHSRHRRARRVRAVRRDPPDGEDVAGRGIPAAPRSARSPSLAPPASAAPRTVQDLEAEMDAQLAAADRARGCRC